MKWYEEDVDTAVKIRERCPYKPETVFYGSSSFTLWANLYQEFEEFKPVNLAFGGSTLAACVQFFDRIIAPLPKPQRLILYAGDNDLGDGADPHDVFKNYLLFKSKLRHHFDDVPFYYVSIKPSLTRLEIIDKIIKTNFLIKENIKKQEGNDYYINIFNKMVDHKGLPQKKFFEGDGLHLNHLGYDVWKEAIMNELMLTEQLL
ncbi:MAG: GDSL family lipase [Chitinophagaceae bacterium]|nr:GDSL family lipase [Chitinophagaceae bacterium]